MVGVEGKEVLTVTEDEVLRDDKENGVMLINEENIRDRVYVIRGQKVMLDVDLAEIYGYTTKRFNEQVKNNIGRFDIDFRFQLTNDEIENLRSKKSTSSWGGSRYKPYAFTEQGIYMLMTVLKGDLAIQQSKALIRTFKRMKDYIIENQDLIGRREYLQLSMQVSDNIRKTMDLREDLNKVEDKMSFVMDRLSDVVMKSEISDYMNEFGEPHIKRGYLILNGHPFMGDLAYAEIYGQAKNTIDVIDNYIGLKTLVHLIGVNDGVEVRIYSDNLRRGLRKEFYEDFCKEYPNLQISFYRSGGVFHDRYIILDHGTEDEKIFLCGGSSKDVGSRATTILEDQDREKYQAMIAGLRGNPSLILK